MEPSGGESGRELDLSIPGMRIEILRGPEPALVVKSVRRIEEWRPRLRTLEERLLPDRVPTTVLHRDEAYHIDEAEETSAGWIYRLIPLPAGEIRRDEYVLSREAVAERARLAEEHRRLTARTAIWGPLGWIFGWLPARWQEALGDRLGFSADDATRVQALIQFLLASAASAVGAILLVAGGIAGLEVNAGLLLPGFLVVDGIARWFHARVDETPMGFLPLEILERFGRGIARLAARAAGREAGDAGEDR